MTYITLVQYHYCLKMISALGNEEFLVNYELSSEEDLNEGLIKQDLGTNDLRTDTPEMCQVSGRGTWRG